jgi:hypothetical protein
VNFFGGKPVDDAVPGWDVRVCCEVFAVGDLIFSPVGLSKAAQLDGGLTGAEATGAGAGAGAGTGAGAVAGAVVVVVVVVVVTGADGGGVDIPLDFGMGEVVECIEDEDLLVCVFEEAGAVVVVVVVGVTFEGFVSRDDIDGNGDCEEDDEDDDDIDGEDNDDISAVVSLDAVDGFDFLLRLRLIPVANGV